MTVLSDLQTATGIERALYLKIDGFNAIFFQRHDRGDPAGWSRTPKTCLRAPQEMDLGLDLGENACSLNAMTFELDDFLDTDGASYFAKYFAPLAWHDSTYTHVAYATTAEWPWQQIDTNAEDIPVRNTAKFAASGTAYIGSECFTFGAKNADHLTGCSKGLYPITGSAYGQAYPRFQEGDRGYQMHVGTQPISYIGKRVALYVTTWDKATEAWNSEDNSELLWVGRISDSIQYDEKKQCWKVSCVSILEDLNKEICVEMPESELNGINLYSREGRSFDIRMFSRLAGGDGMYIMDCGIRVTVTQGIYHLIQQNYNAYWKIPEDDLSRHINDALSFDNWTIAANRAKPCWIWLSYSEEQNRCFFSLSHGSKTRDVKVVIEHATEYDTNPANASLNKPRSVCHPLRALGFKESRYEIELLGSSMQYYEGNWHDVRGDIFAEEAPYFSYQPLHHMFNGYRIPVKDPDAFIFNQGDGPIDRGYCMIADAVPVPGSSSKISYYFSTNDSDDESILIPSTDPTKGDILTKIDDLRAFAGSNNQDKPTIVKQVYIPEQRSYNWGGSGNIVERGPFELLLYPLLSTGTENYNHSTYDKLPRQFGLGIQSDLIDCESFRRADEFVTSMALSKRQNVAISKPTKFIDLLKQECKLYGFSLCWDNGKLRLKKTSYPDLSLNAVTLDDDTRAFEDEIPKVSVSSSTVINQYKCNVFFNPDTRKFDAPTYVTDIDSVRAIGITREVEITHGGLNLDQIKDVNPILQDLLLSRFNRYPLPVVECTISPPYITKVSLGDVVRFKSDLVYDQFGVGTRTCDAYGLVINKSINYEKWFGKLRLILFKSYSSKNIYWCPSAVINAGGSWGGWNSATYQMVLVAHTFTNTDMSEDGNAFLEGDQLWVVDRAPWNVADAQKWGPLCVASDYATDGAQILTFETGTSLTGYDQNKEYIVTYAAYDEVTSDQLDRGTWLGDAGSIHILNTRKCGRWGK